jgi:hypothetical protein
MPTYAAMKGGGEVLTRYMAKELGTRKVTVNVVAPYASESDFAGGVVRDNKEVNQFIASQTAGLGRCGRHSGDILLSRRSAEEMVHGCRDRLAGEIRLTRQCKKGLLHGHHPKLPIVREAESNSGETPRRYRKMRCLQSTATRNG